MLQSFRAHILPLLLSASCLTGISAAEFFVSAQGDDSRSGATMDQAFGSIQRGLDALSPGDTLTIGPGEYFGAVSRKDLGSDEVTTTIRAAVPGTVLLRGDRDIGDFHKVEGTRFVYATAWEEEPQGVHEIDTLSMLTRLNSVQELTTQPGSYFFDPEAKLLYLVATDMASPDRHRYAVSVVPDHGFYLENPRRVTLTGLAATGFNANVMQRGIPGFGSVWGFMIYLGQDSVMDNLTAFLNGGGIATQNRGFRDPDFVGRGTRIANCLAYGNGSQFAMEGGNIAGFFPNADTIENCTAYLGFPNGIRLYQQGNEFSLIRNCFARAHTAQGIQTKGTNTEEMTKSERSISIGSFSAMQIEHSIFRSNYAHQLRKVETSNDNIMLSRERIDQNLEFADPDNFDFRLQSTSRFRGTGPEGSDRGPFPYQPNIYYVSPEGDDSADGLSIGTAWKNAAQALTRLKAGDTLYLEPGEYEIGSTTLENLGSEEALTSIRRRGTDPVTLRGTLTLKDVTNLSLERLQFSDPLTIQNSRDIVINQSVLSGQPVNLQSTSTKGLRITHCQFENGTQAAIVLGAAPALAASPATAQPRSEKSGPGLLDRILDWFQKQPPAETAAAPQPEAKPSKPLTAPASAEEGLFLQSNLFTETTAPAVVVAETSEVLYSDYNLYASPHPWTVAGTSTSLEALPPQFDSHSGAVDPNAANFSDQLIARGAFGKPAGPHPPTDRKLSATTPEVRSVSATTANLEWFTSQPATCELAWGPTEACENKVSFDVSGYGTYSLTGLEPGKKYYFRLESATIPEALQGQLGTSSLDRAPEMISFTTKTEDPEPRTYYVSTSGSNTNSGLSPEESFQTIAHAAETVAPGDTVIIEGGNYSEQVVITSTGDKHRPITFRAKEGDLVQLTGNNRSLTRAFVIGGKSHLRFDGFVSRGFGLTNSIRWSILLAGVFNIYDSDDIQILRCFNDGRGAGYSAPLVQAFGTRNLLIQNCVAVRNAGALRLSRCPDTTIENCVIMLSNIQNMVLPNAPEEKITIRNTILGDNQPSKVHVQAFEISNARSLISGNNCYFFRRPDEDRKAFLFGDIGDVRRMSAADFNKQFGKAPSLVANPDFAGLDRVPTDREKEDYDADALLRIEDLKFSDFFARNPEVLQRKIGLDPQAFESQP